MTTDLEGAVIAAALHSHGDVLDTVELTPEHFAVRSHRLVWEAMQRCQGSGLPHNDPVVLGDLLSERGLEWSEYSAQLPWVDDYKTDNLEHYAALLREYASTRLLREGLVRVSGATGGFVDLCDQAYAVLDKLTHYTDQGGTVNMAEAAREEYASVEAERSSPDHTPRYIRTGYPSLDQAIVGWELTNLAIVAARPSMGKSALLRSCAYHAVKAGAPVLHVTPEDTHQAYARRQLAAMSGVDIMRLRQPKVLTAQELDALKQASQELEGYRDLWLVDGRKYLDSQAICRLIRRYRNSHGIQLVTVDYIQLVTATGVKAAEDQQSHVSVALKQIGDAAAKAGVALVVASQLNRKCEDRDDPRPQLADLKWSGKLEEAADVVLFPYRPEYYRARGRPGVRGDTCIIVAKAKNGRVCDVPMVFDESVATYREES